MRRSGLSFIMMATLVLSSGVFASEVDRYFGTWHITQVAEFAAITAVSDRDAERNIGKTLVLSEKTFVYDNQKCTPRYTLLRINPDEELQEGYRIANDVLRLHNPTVLIDTGCLDGKYIYTLDTDTAFIENEGVFYRAVREKK